MCLFITLLLLFQENAELAVRDMLKQIGESTLKNSGTTTLEACDQMDDGSVINLKVSIDIEEVRYSQVVNL